MARRRSYYGYPSVGGFAEGFQGGFGLVNEIYADREASARKDRELDLDEELLDIRKTETDTKSKDAQRRLIDSENTKTRLGIQASKEARETKILDSNLETSEFNLAKSKYEFEEIKSLDKEKKSNASQNDLQANAAINIQSLLTYYDESMANGTYDASEFRRRYDGIRESHKGLAQGLDPELMFSAPAYGTFAEFQQQLQKAMNGQGFKPEVAVDMANIVLIGNNKKGVNDPVTEEAYPYAPKNIWGKGYRITNKTVRSLDILKNDDGTPKQMEGPDGAMLNQYTAEVVVTAMSPGGREVVWIAPLSEQRSGTSERVILNDQQFFQSASGIMTYAREIRRLKPAIQNARKISDKQFLDETNKFDEPTYLNWLNAKKSAFREKVRNIEDDPSEIPGVTNLELMSNSELFEDYVLTDRYNSSALQPRRKNKSIDDYIETIRQIPEMQRLERDRIASKQGDGLSDRQVLAAQAFFTQRSDGTIVLDKDMEDDWNKFKNELMGRNSGGGGNRSGAGKYSPRPTYNISGYQTVQQNVPTGP